MQDTLSNFLHLKQSHPEELSLFLIEHRKDVILSLGGFTSMIELCLTNPAAEQHVDIRGKQFQAFNKKLSKQMDEISINSNDITTIINETNNDDNEIKIDHDQNKTRTNVNINISHSSVHGKLQIIDTATAFYQSKIMIDCNPKNNFLFKFIPNDNCASNMYKAILSPINLYIIVLLYFLSIILEYFEFLVSGTVVEIFRIINYVIGMFYYIGIGLTGNLLMIDLILNTFDFWFKVYNLFTLILAMWVHANNTDPVGIEVEASLGVLKSVSAVLYYVSSIMVILILFVLDALPLSMKIKRVFIVAFVVSVSQLLIVIYFNYPDFEWNPLGNSNNDKFKYTQISFKSLMLSSWFNLMIFISKPIFSDVMRFLIRTKSKFSKCNSIKICRNQNDSDTTTKGSHDTNLSDALNENTYRCGTIHKRPWVKCNKIDSAETDATTILN